MTKIKDQPTPIIAAHRRGDHAMEQVKGCRLCAGRPDTRCQDCLNLRCLGCKKNHCAKHCRGRKPNAIRKSAQFQVC